MRIFNAIVKKHIVEVGRTVKKSFKTSALSAILSILTTILFLSFFIFILAEVVESYTGIMYNGLKNPSARQFELLTIFYTIIMIVNIFSSLKQFNKFLFYNDELKIYVTLPIKSSTLFSSVMLFIFLRQVLSSLIYTFTINAVFVKVTGISTNILLASIPVAILLPAFSIAVASIIAVPILYLQNIFRNKYLLTLIVMTAFVGLGFLIYSSILDVFSEMVLTGEIKFFFSKKVMDFIIGLSNILYPSIFYARFTLGVEMGKNIAIIIALTVGSLLIGMIIINQLLVGIIKSKLQLNKTLLIEKKHSFSKKSLFSTLLSKEIIATLRTPSYAFQYFTTALIMPLITMLCIKLGNEFAYNLIGLRCDFEIAIFCVFIFSMITNTYCATNISRDGDCFFALKSYPITAKQYVGIKIFFCTLISVFAILITVILIGSLGMVDAIQSVFIFLSCCLFSFSQICFATHLDLSNPHFSKEENCEVKENNSTSSMVSVIGLIVSTLVGGSSLLVRIILGLKGLTMNILYSYLISGLASLVFCIIAFLSLWVNIDKLYSKIKEG